VVRVEDVGRYGDSYFIAMEYVHGASLAELLAQVRRARVHLDAAIVIWLTAQIAEALHAAHEARSDNGAPLGIVHHDVSPENVLVSETGHVKLIDFGIAKSRAEPEERQGRAAVRGKLRFMAPEQLLREPADRRADVYSLGVMLWEMLTGRRLLRCASLDDPRDWSRRSAPPAPSQVGASTAPELDRAVLKAIAYDRADRYGDALQFRAALLASDAQVAHLDAPEVARALGPLLDAAMAEGQLSWDEPTAAGVPGATLCEPAGCGAPTAPATALTLGWPYSELSARVPGAR
jgi:serine/threonine-protein kinase